MSRQIIQDKSFQLAIKIVKLCGYLQDSKKDYVISKQLLKIGTSIGANIRFAYEADNQIVRLQKFQTAFKKTQETIYWLDLLAETKILNQEDLNLIVSDCEEVLKMLQNVIEE
jgi:four helix bundle protein